MPLGLYNFHSLPWSLYPSAEERLSLFHDTLVGLHTIHEMNLMHRDIQVKNLLVLNTGSGDGNGGGDGGHDHNGFRAAICDFGKAVKAVTHTETGIGPIPTVAPEVWSGLSYSNKIDVWSLGYAWASTFRKPPDHDRTDTARISRLKRWIDGLYQDGLIPAPLFDLLVQMLVPDPTCRPSAADAMQHPLWKVLREKGTEEGRRHRHRHTKAEIEAEAETFGSPDLGIRSPGGSPPAKRARIPSPGDENSGHNTGGNNHDYDHDRHDHDNDNDKDDDDDDDEDTRPNTIQSPPQSMPSTESF